MADCFGLEHFGAIFGLTFAAYGFVAGPLGPTLSGYLLDVTGDNFFLVFLYLGIFCLLAGLVHPAGSAAAKGLITKTTCLKMHIHLYQLRPLVQGLLDCSQVLLGKPVSALQRSARFI